MRFQSIMFHKWSATLLASSLSSPRLHRSRPILPVRLADRSIAIFSLSSSDVSISVCELTEHILRQPWKMLRPPFRPVLPKQNNRITVRQAAATPITILVVDNIPSLAPSTAALNQLLRFVKCSPACCIYSSSKKTKHFFL